MPQWPFTFVVELTTCLLHILSWCRIVYAVGWAGGSNSRSSFRSCASQAAWHPFMLELQYTMLLQTNTAFLTIYRYGFFLLKDTDFQCLASLSFSHYGRVTFIWIAIVSWEYVINFFEALPLPCALIFRNILAVLTSSWCWDPAL